MKTNKELYDLLAKIGSVYQALQVAKSWGPSDIKKKLITKYAGTEDIEQFLRNVNKLADDINRSLEQKGNPQFNVGITPPPVNSIEILQQALSTPSSSEDQSVTDENVTRNAPGMKF